MKKTILVIVVTMVLSLFLTIACTIESVDAVTTANLQSKGPNKPVYITLEEAQVLINEAIANALTGVYSGTNPTLTGIYYSRRETLKDPYDGISTLEEINSEDYKVQVARGGRGSFFWMDDNIGNANINLDINEIGGYSGVHINNLWLQFTQDKGIYHFENLKTFETNEEAKIYFSSNGWNQNNVLYRTSDGTVKATY
jgi:hypothetical protein